MQQETLTPRLEGFRQRRIWAKMRLGRSLAAAIVASLLISAQAHAQALTTPKDAFGHNIGDDYFLPTYTQTEAYFAKLATESDRIKILSIGRTVEGRDMQLIAVSSPTNLANMDKYKAISASLARAEGLTHEQARTLAKEGKAVVWIDAAIHSFEVASTDQMIETVWQLASGNDEETTRMLEDVIVLFAHCNPDGQEMVSNWYMRRPEPETRVKELTPEPDKKWIFGESNRDFFMMNMPETTHLNRQLYLEWFPQITYNHHGATYAGAVVAGPPFRDPFNFVYDPLVITSLDAVAAAMNNRWAAKDMPGATQRTGNPYSTWWNGGIRNTGYFHNFVGLLTEIMGYPTPEAQKLVPYRLQPKGETPFPVQPGGIWHYRRSIDYLVEANKAVIDYASRHRNEVLFNIYKMGKNSIERGSRDHWTPYPKRQEAMLQLYAADVASGKVSAQASDRSRERFANLQALSARTIPLEYYDRVMRNPALRDPRGFIIPSDQPDFPTAVKFVNALIKAGIRVQKATQPFTVNGKSYPAGSYVVKTDQAFRPHVLDMFEPQDYPNDFPYPGAPPTAPYDAAGWTLAFEMGIKFDRVLDGFDGPFVQLPWGELQTPPPGKPPHSGAGWVISAFQNDSFTLINALMSDGIDVYRLEGESGNPGFGSGSFFVSTSRKSAPLVARAIADHGLNVASLPSKPNSPMKKLTRQRIAIWDKYGGSAPGGWTRWTLGQFGFSDNRIFSQEIDKGNLRKKYDVLVFANDGIRHPDAPDEPWRGSSHSGPIPPVNDVPPQYRGYLGEMSKSKSIPQLRKFVEDGGTIITLGSSGSLAYHFNLPVESALTQTVDGKAAPLSADKYSVPGSILKVALNKSASVTWGTPETLDVFFDSGPNTGATGPATPVFKLGSNAAAAGVTPIAWFDREAPLRSGWVWGEDYLKGNVAAFEAPIGKGRIYVYAPQVAFRGQTHGAYRLLFNALYGE